MCRGTSHTQMALKLSTSQHSTCISHPFFLPYTEKRLLAATPREAQRSQNKQAGRKVSACCASLQVPLCSSKQPALGFSFPCHVSLLAASFHGKEKGFIRNSRGGKHVPFSNSSIVVRYSLLLAAHTAGPHCYVVILGFL